MYILLCIQTLILISTPLTMDHKAEINIIFAEFFLAVTAEIDL